MLTNCLAACAHLTITVSEIARYWSKIVIFSHPLAFDALVRGVPVGISPPRSVRKNRIMWLPDCENFFEDIFIRFDASHERDRQTDRQTPHADIYCAYAYASRGNNAIHCSHWQSTPYQNHTTYISKISIHISIHHSPKSMITRSSVIAERPRDAS